MKKFTVFILVMALTGTAVFAQNFTFGGYINSGLGLTAVDVDDQDASISAFGVDSEQPGYRFRLNGAYQNEAKTSGIRVRLQAQANTERRSNGYLSIPYVYGYMNYFDNKLNLLGGLIMDSSWETTDWWIADDVGEGLGALIKLNPIEGLSFGAGAYLISQEGGGRNNQLSRGLNTTNSPNASLDAEDLKYVFGASYMQKDVFYLGASFRTENQAGDETPVTNEGRQETSALIGDLRIFAVPNLTAVVAFSFDNIMAFDVKGLMVFSESFGFKATDEFNLGLNAVQFISNEEKKDDVSMLFNLWGSYAIKIVVPRLDLTYFIGGNSHATNYHRRGYTGPTYDYDYSVFSIRPSVRINLDNRTHFEIGNVTHIDMSEEEQKAWDDSKQKITNVFYIDFRWSF